MAGPSPALQQAERRSARVLEWMLPELEGCGLWQEQGGAVSSPVPEHSASAAVTGLPFLQVPPYPEVFQDSLHTYKLNEQDTDVRAAYCSLRPAGPTADPSF